jgi:hypothetical protein
MSASSTSHRKTGSKRINFEKNIVDPVNKKDPR